MTNGDERRSDSVFRHILLNICAVIIQFRDRDQIVQRRVLLRFGGIFSSDEGQLFACADGHRLGPGIELGLADYAEDALHGKVVTTPRFNIRGVAVEFV